MFKFLKQINMKNEVKKTNDFKGIEVAVMNRIKGLVNNGELHLPPNYSAENAMKSAGLILQEKVDKNKVPVLESCSKTSIINTLFEMIIKGLNPAKSQCYFIPYNGILSLDISYFGDVAMAKRFGGLKTINAKAIYKKDEFKYETINGLTSVLRHVEDFNSMGKLEEISGAYAVVTLNDGTVYAELMNVDQIKQAWAQRKGEPMSASHINFSDQMACKTVISRACKFLINESDDSALFILNKAEKEPATKTIDIDFEEEIEDIKEEPKAIENAPKMDFPEMEIKASPLNDKEQFEAEF